MQDDDPIFALETGESVRLLAPNEGWIEMAPANTDTKDQSIPEARCTDGDGNADISRQDTAAESERRLTEEPVVYKVYRIRWFGLTQLVLLNIIVSWDWLSFSPVASTAATFFSTNTSVINWLSTAFLFAFVVASPATVYALYHGGPRLSLIAASTFILLGNWIRYAGARSSPPRFGVVMFGQILTGLAQPFVLSAPTHYSDLWFTPQGRVSATAVASLANPFGGALGQLINPFLCTRPSDIPNMTLYVAIVSSVATIPTFFLPAKPPTPVAPSSTTPRPGLPKTLSILGRNPNFWLLLIPFSVYVGLFNSISSILEQVLSPYGFSETSSGTAGALLILAGLVSAAVTSPIVDRSKKYLLLIRIFVPIIALCDLIFIWAPGTRGVAVPYAILSFLGAANFSLVPVVLEWLAEMTFPAGPEASSTVCWVGGQLLGAIFVIISDALKAGEDGDPPFNMGRALVFQAVIGIASVVPAMLLGVIWKVNVGRLGVDKAAFRRDAVVH